MVRFSTETEPLFGGLVPADRDHIAKAESFVDGLSAMGGTAIADALDEALSLPGAPERPSMVIFLTDGIPTVGETSEDALVDRVTRAGRAPRIFTFGIGNDVNAHLLDRIASGTRGASQYVLPEEDIEVKVSSFYAKINQPVFRPHPQLHEPRGARHAGISFSPARSFQRGHPGRVRTLLRLRGIGRQDQRPVQRKEARVHCGP